MNLSEIVGNFRQYLDVGGLVAIIALLVTIKIKNRQIGSLTVDKILAESKAKEDELNGQIDASEKGMDKIRKEYQDAYNELHNDSVHVSNNPDSKG